METRDGPVQSSCGKMAGNPMMSRRCRGNEGRLEAGREREDDCTVELRSRYSGSGEIDFVVGSRGKGGRRSFCTSYSSKRWASRRSVWGSVGNRRIGRARQFHNRGRSAQRLSLQAVGGNRLWREKRAAVTTRFLLCVAANQWGFSLLL